MKKLSINLQEHLFRLYRWRWPLIVSLLWLSTAVGTTGRFVFFGATAVFTLFVFFYQKTFKKFTCVVCKGKGKVSKKNKWVIGKSSTCYACDGEGTVRRTNYNDLLNHTKKKRKSVVKQIVRLQKEVKGLEVSISHNQDILKNSTVQLVNKKIASYQKHISFREKILSYLDNTERNVHKILANIHLLKRVQKADTDLNEKYSVNSEEEFKELYARQGRLEYDLSRLEGELYSMESHLSETVDQDITSELEVEMDQLMLQMKNLLRDE